MKIITLHIKMPSLFFTKIIINLLKKLKSFVQCSLAHVFDIWMCHI